MKRMAGGTGKLKKKHNNKKRNIRTSEWLHFSEREDSSSSRGRT